ncbi:core protein precursor pX [Goose adenovirus 4]|nr:core protein precursor pX [Goose adenovirus 4]
MPAVVLTGGRTKAKRRRSTVSLPRIPRIRKRPRYISVKNPSGNAESERAALQSLAQRFQRGNLTGWRSAVTEAAAKTAAATGSPASATNLSTGQSAHAVPLSGSGLRGTRKRRVARKSSGRSKKPMRGGFFPALIPLIAAAIGAIPGIAGTAVGIANLKEQQRQYNEQMKLQREQMERLYGKKTT